MRVVTDLTGKRFGRWTVVSQASIGKQHHARWNCVCDCGNKRIVYSTVLLSGHSNSCGCLARELQVERFTTHGQAGIKHITPEYRSWRAMKNRCLNPHNDAYDRYGGRGVTVYSGWTDDFQAFLDHIGPRPSRQHSLDRMDNEGNYEPGNVRWATPKEQANNRRKRRFYRKP